MKTDIYARTNTDHLCILKRLDNGNLDTDFETLENYFIEELAELDRLNSDNEVEPFQMESFIASSRLGALKGGFNYCYDLYGSYQEISRYKSLDAIRYYNTLSKLEQKLAEAKFENLQNAHKRDIRNHKEWTKKRILNDFKVRALASDLSSAYHKCREDKSIVAYSHRMAGYSHPVVELGEDFRMGFHTNFGYGYASYFHTNITYKGIPIRPYSDWIRYRIANKSEIIRYTRAYPLENRHWHDAMSFAAEKYEQSVKYPESFINLYIINECERMIDGLESLTNSDRKWSVKTSYFDREKTIELTEHEFYIFKGERLSGGLDFIDGLRQLSEISPRMDGYIIRILKCVKRTNIQLKQIIVDFEKKIAHFNREMGALQISMNETEQEIKAIRDNSEDIESAYSQANSGERPGYWRLEELLNEKYPQLESLEKQYDDMRSNLSKCTEERDKHERTNYYLLEFIENIEKHEENQEIA